MLHYIILFIAWTLMLIGFVGVVAPALPGIPVILLGMVLYAYQTDFSAISLNFLAIMGLFTLAGLAADYLSGIVGAKKYGASQKGVWGAFFGGIAGFFLLPGWGIIIGPLLGAIAGEMFSGKSSQDATRVGWGTFLGILTGTLLKLVIGITMIGLFIRQLF